MRRRTRARELAVQFLYQLDLRGEESLDSLQDFLVFECKDNETRIFARQLIDGTRRELANIDALLATVARNWDLKRMAAIDRNVLRMAIHEMFSCHDIPPKVTINEAIEIGKKFSTINSGAFINGILDRVHLDHLDASGRVTPGLKAGAAALEPTAIVEQVVVEQVVVEQAAEADTQAEEGPALSS